MKIGRAIISVSDKTGVAEFGKALAKMGVEILSTGGTSQTLKKSGVSVKDVSDYTGFPEVMDGRVKTLHPKIYGGILARRDNKEDLKQMKELDIEPIDLVVVNLYLFRQAVADPGVTRDDAIEKIDIGGPTMIRAAAKNQDHVAVVVDPADYDSVIEEMKKNGGGLSKKTRRRLAMKVYAETCDYDGAIVNYLAGQLGEDMPSVFASVGRKAGELRYGENPHQKAAFYVSGPGCLSEAEQISGKKLLFNNYLDLHAAATADITAIIQPGGSKRDKEVITTCNQRDVAVVFAGQRHFRH